MRRGQADEDHGVDGGVKQRRGTGAAAEVAGELRRLLATLHETTKERFTEVRLDAGNRGEVTREVGGVEFHRKVTNTATGWRCSGEKLLEPGGVFWREK